jgi:hypothetical protein
MITFQKDFLKLFFIHARALKFLQRYEIELKKQREREREMRFEARIKKGYIEER